MTADGEVKYEDKDAYKIGPEAQVVLYAIWVPESCKIVFNANGGKGSMEAKNWKVGDYAKMPDCTFTRDGYLFAGWSRIPTGAAEYQKEDIFKIPAETEIVFYALWVKIPDSN